MSIILANDRTLFAIQNRQATETAVRAEVIHLLDRMPAVDSYDDIHDAAWEALQGETGLMEELLPVFPYLAQSYGDLSRVPAHMGKVPDGHGGSYNTWGYAYTHAPLMGAPRAFVRAMVAPQCLSLSTGIYVVPNTGDPLRRVVMQDDAIAWLTKYREYSDIPPVTARIIRAIDVAHGCVAPALTFTLYSGTHEDSMLSRVDPFNVSARKCFAPLFSAVDMVGRDRINIETTRLRDVIATLSEVGSLQECFVKWRRSRRTMRDMERARGSWIEEYGKRRATRRTWTSQSVSELWLDRVAAPLWNAMARLHPGPSHGNSRSAKVIALQSLGHVMDRSISETGDERPDYHILRTMVTGMLPLIREAQQHAKDLT